MRATDGRVGGWKGCGNGITTNNTRTRPLTNTPLITSAGPISLRGDIVRVVRR